MKTTKAHTLRWAVAVIAVIAVAGLSGGAIAKEKKSRTGTPGTETGNGNGYIGVYLQELTSDVRKGLDIDVKQGVLVSGLEDDAPAQLAGIEEGDVIVKFSGRSVDSADELRAAVRDVAPGKEARVDLIRDGKNKTVTVTVGERPEQHGFIWKSDDNDMPMHLGRGMAMFGGPRLGIQAHELEDDGLASYFGAKKGEGLLVLSVDEESVAGKAGVQPGDIISKVGNESIEDTGDVRDALHDYKEGDTFDITVLRHGKTQALKATMDDQEHEFAFTVPGGPEMFRWEGHAPRAPRAPRAPMMLHGDRDDLRRELDDLKKEIRELKEELDARDDG